MFVTILSGHVTHENWTALQKSFEQTIGRRAPDSLLQSALVQSQDDPTLWQIISYWPSKAAFQEAERLEQSHICVKLFCDAGSVPTRRGFTVVSKYTRV